MRHAELQWHAQCLNQRGTTHRAPINKAPLHTLYQQMQERRRIRERQARLGCFALPVLLAFAVHLAW